MQARRTFGTKGFVVASGFLATVVVGWYAFQTGRTGATLHDSFGWNTTLLVCLAAVSEKARRHKAQAVGQGEQDQDGPARAR